METILCDKKCCTIQIKQNITDKTYSFTNKRKAGIFIYDPNSKKVLLVQSNSNLWGAPKGTKKYNENIKNCAKREVWEETGLNIHISNCNKILFINDHATYFYIEQPECPVSLQEHPENDVTGIGWIKVECLEEYIKNGNISLTRHSKILFEHFLKKKFVSAKFQLVKR